MKGRNCLITGATSGIGRATALALGARGANLILLGRNERAGEAVVRQVRRSGGAGTAEFVCVDLSNQVRVRTAAAGIADRHHSLDLLINNAGARNDCYQSSPDGIELTFACNHLGHFLLTCLLLDRLIAAPAARIISVSSGSHAAALPGGSWELPAKDYDRRQAYARSKLANIVFACSLAGRLRKTRVVSNAYDPGGVASNFSRNNGLLSWGRHLLAHALHKDLISPTVAADGIVHLACEPELQSVTGSYFRRRVQIPPPASCRDAAAAKELWELSVRLTGLDESIGSSAWSIVQP